MPIDLNGDLGESYGRWQVVDDRALMVALSSVNLACGFHAGDPSGLRLAVRAALDHRLAIGAHPSYPDLRGFGRVAMALPPEQVRDDVLYQLGALQALCHAEGETIRHVKPHGALYHAVADDPATAEAVGEAVASFDVTLPVVVRSRSRGAEVLEEAGLQVLREAFLDRQYRNDGRLVPRSRPDALVTDPVEIAERAVRLATEGSVVAIDGTVLSLAPHTLCLHGDGRDAGAVAIRVRDALEGAGVEVRAGTT
ncbi:5-oxoprolinase subunit PxpA [soil metagenome]|nr:LamB/YcsF family protein [Trueperaceae bacterium]